MYFGCYETIGSDAPLARVARGPQLKRDAKVGNTRSCVLRIIRQQDVERLDVPVHDADIMQILEPLRNIQQDATSEDFSLLDRLCLSLLQKINQCAAPHVRGDDVEVLGVFDSLHKTYNIFAPVLARVLQTLYFLEIVRVPSVELAGGLLAHDLDGVLVV